MNKFYLSVTQNALFSLKPATALRLLLMILIICVNTTFAQRTSSNTGNWSAAGTWTPAIINRSGTVTSLTTSTTVTGTGTLFLTELSIGSVITTQGGIAIGTVAAIASNTSLTLAANAINNVTQIYRTTSGPPSPNDTVTIAANHTVTLNGAFSCASLSIGTNNNIATLTFAGPLSQLTVNGLVTLGDAGGINRRGSLIMTNGGILNCQGFIVANTGANNFTAGTGTVVLTANNTLPTTRFTSFNNLTISAGTTVFGAAITIANNLSINAGAIANLGTFTHTAGTLMFAGAAQVTESFGSTFSPADNKNNLFFATTTGIVNNNCTPPVITQPIPLTICENSGGSFTVTTLAPSPTFQWQYSLNNTNWINTNSLVDFSGHNGAILSLNNASAAYNGYFVRCVVRSSTGCRTNSNSVLLTVNGIPATTETITPATCNVSDGAITITGLENIPIEFRKADNDYINLGSPFLSGRNAFTVEGWIKFNIADVGPRMSLFGQNDVIEFFLDNNAIVLYTNGGGFLTTPLTGALGNNAWHHIAATGDGTILRLYIDGSLVVSVGAITGGNYGSSTFNAQIGSGVVDPLTTAGGGFTGQIKKVGFYSTALSPATILSLSSSPVTYLGTEAGLIAGYNFTEGSGTTLTRVPAGTNGILTNSPQWIFYTYSWTKTGSPSIIASTKNITGLSSGVYNLSIGITGLSCPKVISYSVSPTNIYTTSWSLGTPTANQNIEFAGNYAVATNIVACSCTVTSGAVSIPTGNYLKLGGQLTVNTPGTLTFENNASLVQTTFTGANLGNITYKRAGTTIREFDYTYWSSPVETQNLLAVSPSTKLDKFYSFDAVTENWFQETPSSTTMVVGKGYIIRGIPQPPAPAPPGFQTALFFGVPNNGNKSIPVAGGVKSNLIGNPYPSAVYADQFLWDNRAVIDGTIYFWTHNTPIAIGTPDPGTGYLAYSGNDYASYSITGGVGTGAGIGSTIPGTPPTENVSNRPTGKIAAGQSFFTTSTAAGGNATFTNAMRVDGSNNPFNNSNFYKTKNAKTKTVTSFEKHRVWLNLTNKEGAFKQTLVGYITEATNTWDSLFDGMSFDGNNFLDFYSINNEKNLTIQGRALPFDENDEVPLGYRIEVEGMFTISIDETDGLLGNQNIFILDKLLDKVVNLKEGNYTFNTAAGTFDDRFVLLYTNKTLGTTDVNIEDNAVQISIKNQKIQINSFDVALDKVTIYDLLGRQIYHRSKVNNNEVVLSDFVSSHQTLIVKTSLQSGIIVTKKVVY